MKICKNSEGVYRVDKGNGWLRDDDLMFCISSNHRSKILNFSSESEARAAMRDYETKLEMMAMTAKPYAEPPTPEVKEDFKEI